MPLEVINLDPQESPTKYYETHASDTLGCIPDGTGLQIIFKIDGNDYLLAGPRAGSLLTVNGGKIENNTQSFFSQIIEEVDEESFGVLKVIHDNKEGYQLIVSGKKHALHFEMNKTIQKYKPGVYAYITFTATCEDISLDDLKNLANQLSPTAKFWAQIGGFLFDHVRIASKCENFKTYWQEQQGLLNTLLSSMTTQYHELRSQNQLLITPEQAFEVDELNSAWNAIRNLDSFEALKRVFQHTVGRYSERDGYYIFRTTDVYQLTQGTTNISDISGTFEASKVFNDDAVATVFPLLGADKASTQSTERDSIASLVHSGYSFLASKAGIPETMKQPIEENILGAKL